MCHASNMKTRENAAVRKIFYACQVDYVQINRTRVEDKIRISIVVYDRVIFTV